MSRSIHESRAKKGFHHVDWDEIATGRGLKRLVREDRLVAKGGHDGQLVALQIDALGEAPARVGRLEVACATLEQEGSGAGFPHGGMQTP